MSALDPIARGMAAQAKVSLRRSAIAQRALATHAASRGHNPVELAAMASPPTIGTTSVSAPSGVTTGYQLDAANTYITEYGTWTGSAGNRAPAYGYGRFAFITDAPKLALRMSANGSSFHNIGIMIDRQYSGAIYNPGIAQSTAYTPIDFSGVRAFRRFDVDLIGYPNALQVNVGATDTLYPVTKSEPRVVFVGDSYTGATGAARPGSGWANVVGWLNGWETCWDYSGPGGGGYISLTSAGSKTFLDRIAGVTGQSPAAIVVAGGINDASNSAASITTAALAYFRALRSGNPLAPILVLGVWPGASGPSAGVIACENAIKAAFDAWADPGSRFIPVSTAAKPVLFGTGRTGSTNGTGNADLYIGGADGSDSVHPTDAGHAYLGRWAAPRLREAIASIAGV